MLKQHDPINSAEQLLTEIRPQVDDCADYSACRNIVEISRQHIIKLLSTQGYIKTVKKHRTFIQKTLFLSDLLQPETSQIIPDKTHYTLDLWRFIQNEYEPVILDEQTVEKIDLDIDNTLNDLFTYLDESYSNVDSIFAQKYKPMTQEVIHLDQLVVSQVHQISSLPELASSLASILNVKTANRMFSQIFELNRILFKYDLSKNNLTQYINQQDILFNAFTGFQMCTDFSFFNSPVGTITPVNKHTLNLALEHSGLAQIIVEKTCELVALEWLHNSLDLIADNFPEDIVRSILDVSGVYSTMNFESRQRFDYNFQHPQLHSFIQSAIEMGSNGSMEQAENVLEFVYDRKYQNLILKSAQDISLDSNQLVHKLVTDLATREYTTNKLLAKIKSEKESLTQEQLFIFKQVINLSLTSPKFRKVVLELFPNNIAIH